MRRCLAYAVIGLLILFAGDAFALEVPRSLVVVYADREGHAFPPPAGEGEYEINANQGCVYEDVALIQAAYGLLGGHQLWRGEGASLKNTYREDYPPGTDLAALIAALEQSPNVDYAFPDGGLEPLSDPMVVEPTDFWYHTTFRWGNHDVCVDTVGAYRQWHLPRLGLDRAWAISQGDSSVIVAVLDTGIDLLHPDLAPLLFWNPNETPDGIDNDQNHYVDDQCGYDFGDSDADVWHDPHLWETLTGCSYEYSDTIYTGHETCYCCEHPKQAACQPFMHLCPYVKGWGIERHGTVMSAIIAAESGTDARADRGNDISAINWKVKILPLKVGRARNQTGPDVTGNVSDAIDALNYLYDNVVTQGWNVRVLNMSVTMDSCGVYTSPIGAVLGGVFADLRAAGVLPVGGAGNCGNVAYNPGDPTLAKRVVYPCRDPNVLCATAVNRDFMRAPYAQTGPALLGYDYYGMAMEGIDICAFGTIGDCDVQRQPCVWAPDMMIPGWEPCQPTPWWDFCLNPDGCFQDAADWHIVGGTPMMTSGATAQTSGVAALIASVYPSLTPAQIEAMILRGAVPLGDINQSIPPEYETWLANNPQYAPLSRPSGYFGAGALNAYRALTLWGNRPDTTLTGNVWMSGDVVVASGVTMTVSAGSHILIAPDNIGGPEFKSGLYVHGSLVLQGTAESPIVIEGWSTAPGDEDWTGIVVGGNGSLVGEHVVIRNAEKGIEAYGDLSLESSSVENCIYGVQLETGINPATLRDVTASECDHGFHIGGATAVLDSCRADHNQYGFYVASQIAAVTLQNYCSATYNTLDGVYCAGDAELGPWVIADNNGRHGIVVASSGGTALGLGYLRAVGNQSGAGLMVYGRDNVVVSNSKLAGNMWNFDLENGGSAILGISGGSGGGNTLDGALAYDIFNRVRNYTIRAEECYWGECVEGGMPDVSVYGSVDLSPYSCNDPGVWWALSRSDPSRPTMARSLPNPFNPCARIQYSFNGEARHVRIEIYDLRGRVIRELVNGVMNGGSAHAIARENAHGDRWGAPPPRPS